MLLRLFLLTLRTVFEPFNQINNNDVSNLSLSSVATAYPVAHV